jgi:hypothetical protein
MKKPSDLLSEGFNLFRNGQVSSAGWKGRSSNQFIEDLPAIMNFIGSNEFESLRRKAKQVY